VAINICWAVGAGKEARSAIGSGLMEMEDAVAACGGETLVKTPAVGSDCSPIHPHHALNPQSSSLMASYDVVSVLATSSSTYRRSFIE